MDTVKNNYNNLLKKMNHEIFETAFYRGTIMSKYILVLILIVFYTYTIYKLAPVKAIIYILFLIFILPFFTQALLSSVPIKDEKPHFPSLRKKYSYTKKNKRIQSNVMLAVYMILIIWQRSYVPQYQTLDLYYYPTYMLALSIVTRIILTLCYYLYIKRQLEIGKL